MNQGNRQYNRGFVGAVILVVVTLIVLGYFHIDVRAIMASASVQENLKYAWELIVTGFFNFIKLIINYGESIGLKLPIA